MECEAVCLAEKPRQLAQKKKVNWKPSARYDATKKYGKKGYKKIRCGRGIN